MNNRQSDVIEGEASETDDESVSPFADCSKEKKSTNQFSRKFNFENAGAAVIEGEASETDEELEVSAKDISIIPPNYERKVLEKARRTHAHVDEKLEQYWRNLGGDTLTMSWRRNQPVLMSTREIEKLIDQTFTTTQSASSYVRQAASIVCRLEDSVSNLIEGAKLIPDSFISKEQL